MYSIGMFSKIHHVTTKTLRHYDEIGLLKPAFTAPDTGYRLSLIHIFPAKVIKTIKPRSDKN